jgi:hypothetical protein
MLKTQVQKKNHVINNVQPIKIENLPKKQGFTSAFLKKITIR